MNDEFLNDLLQSLPTLENGVDSIPQLNKFRSHVRTVLESGQNPTITRMELAWAMHSLLNESSSSSSSNGKNEYMSSTTNLTIPQQLTCLAVLEAVVSPVSSMHRGNSHSHTPAETLDAVSASILPIAFRDTCLVLKMQQPNLTQIEYDCLMDLLESLVPAAVGNEKYDEMVSSLSASTVSVSAAADAAAASIEPKEQDIVDQAPKLNVYSVRHMVRAYATQYNNNDHVSPVLWANSENERNIIQQLMDSKMTEQRPVSIVKQTDLLAPLHAVDAPFPRPLPPPLLPIYGYQNEEPLNQDEETGLVEYLHSELLWLTPSNLGLMLLPEDDSDDEDDDDQGDSKDFQYVIEQLQNVAFQSPLPPPDQRKLLQILGSARMACGQEKMIQLVEQLGLTPQNLPRLVEHNPLLSHECLLTILSYSDESTKNEYLSALVGMDMTLHAMEVVNRLATHNVTNPDSNNGEPILHPEYINLFISSCIASCENIQDRHAQNRLVRLVCVFIQSLLRNKIVSVDDIYFEVQAFCIEFSRIREAAALFKLLKSI